MVLTHYLFFKIPGKYTFLLLWFWLVCEIYQTIFSWTCFSLILCLSCSWLHTHRFPMQEAPAADKVKIMFENGADFFGRIIIYSLDVLGEKASWFFSLTPHERGSDLSKGYRLMWWRLGNMPVHAATSWADMTWPFLVWMFSSC